MPITSFDGSTFVAYVDISGFKELMKEGERAWNALNLFYQIGFDSISESHGKVQGLFVSDSGILFSRDDDGPAVRLNTLLSVIRTINRTMLDSDYMLTTSIAYGEFRFHEKIEFPGIGKNPVYGNAFVQAFSDNASGSPKIEPGFCRLVRNNLPAEIISGIASNAPHNLLTFLADRSGDTRHIYFYWNVDDPVHIKDFEHQYTSAYSLKYAGMLKALKKGANAV